MTTDQSISTDNCPKCGTTRQSSNEIECRNCGVIFAKIAEKPSKKTPAEPRRRHPLIVKLLAALKKAFRYFLYFVAFCVAIYVYGYFERRAEKIESQAAAQAEEKRRSAITPEQRKEEDRAKLEAAKKKAKAALEVNVKQKGDEICERAWRSQLKDPYSAILEGFEGGIAEGSRDGDYIYFANIHGRAKNSFGAYLPGAWYCAAEYEAGVMKVTNFGGR